MKPKARRLPGTSGTGDDPPAGGRALPDGLVKRFCRSGNIRRPHLERLCEGSTGYKKGWEVRIVVADAGEVLEVQRLLVRAGLRVAAPYRKGRRMVQPVYGREAVQRFEASLAPRAAGGRKPRAARGADRGVDPTSRRRHVAPAKARRKSP